MQIFFSFASCHFRMKIFSHSPRATSPPSTPSHAFGLCILCSCIYLYFFTSFISVLPLPPSSSPFPLHFFFSFASCHFPLHSFPPPPPSSPPLCSPSRALGLALPP